MATIVEEKCARNKLSTARLRGQLQNTENGGQKMSPRAKCTRESEIITVKIIF